MASAPILSSHHRVPSSSAISDQVPELASTAPCSETGTKIQSESIYHPTGATLSSPQTSISSQAGSSLSTADSSHVTQSASTSTALEGQRNTAESNIAGIYESRGNDWIREVGASDGHSEEIHLAGQIEEYPTPSGAILPPPDPEDSVLEAFPTSTLKSRRSVGGLTSLSTRLSHHTEAVAADRVKPPECMADPTPGGSMPTGSRDDFSAQTRMPDHSDSDVDQPVASSNTSYVTVPENLSDPDVQRSASSIPKYSLSPDHASRPSDAFDKAGRSSSSSSSSPSQNYSSGDTDPQNELQASLCDIRPASFEGASFVLIKVRDFAFEDADPRHVGARDVSLGASPAKSTEVSPIKSQEEADWTEQGAMGGIQGISGNEGRWRGVLGTSDDWGSGLSSDDDEEEFEGDEGGSGNNDSGGKTDQGDETTGRGPHTPPGLYEVIYDFEAESEHELTVGAGDRVRVVASVDGGWAVGIKDGDGKEGLVPEGYLVWVEV